MVALPMAVYSKKSFGPIFKDNLSDYRLSMISWPCSPKYLAFCLSVYRQGWAKMGPGVGSGTFLIIGDVSA